MKINNTEFDFKISKISDAQKLEKALKFLEKEEKDINASKSGLFETLSAVREMFVEFFKIATGCDVIGDCEDIEEIKGFYYKFLEEVKEQKDKHLSAYSVDRIR